MFILGGYINLADILVASYRYVLSQCELSVIFTTGCAKMRSTAILEKKSILSQRCILFILFGVLIHRWEESVTIVPPSPFQM